MRTEPNCEHTIILTKRRPITSLGIVCMVGLGLGASSVGAADDPLEQSRELANAFGQRLQAALKEALARGRPENAITVCKDRAPAIASELSRQSGAKVARTSLRTRNPANLPEPWAIDVLEAFETEARSGSPPTPMEFYQSEPGKPTRYARAIPIGPPCLMCHGDTLDQEVEAVLDDEYPHDSARGYALGDIRGAFTVAWPIDRERP